MKYGREFGLIVIGDEILFGRRQDRHLGHFRELLAGRGMRLARCWMLPDDPPSLVRHLRFSMSGGEVPVFVCGGIGATPDDRTRGCAADAADRPLERHPEAAAIIEQKFGDKAYPNRIRMADLPSGCSLIPNPVNQIAGFSLNDHHFLPGFPEMAWPMAEWVLENRHPARYPPMQERSLQVLNTPESSLIPIMQALTERFPHLKMFSLPRMGDQPYIELGFRGAGDTRQAFDLLKERLQSQGFGYRLIPSE